MASPPASTNPSTTNNNFEPTEDNPLGGLHVIPDDTLDDTKLPTLYDKAAKLKSTLYKAKTIEDVKFIFDAYYVPELTEILNYVNSPIVDFLFRNKEEPFFHNLAQNAASEGHLEALKYLFARTYIDIKMDNNELLQIAAANGHLKIVKFLVGLGANRESNYNSAVVIAARYGYLEVVKYLVSLGADIKVHDDRAVCLASSGGHLPVVKYLVELGANVRADEDWAILNAARNGHLPVVKYLVGLGASNRTVNNQAIKDALDNNHLDVVKYLVSLL